MNARMRVDINSGTALLLWLAAFFGVLYTSKICTAVADNLILVLTALTTGMGGYLVKRNANNKIDLSAQKAGVYIERGDPLK